MKTVATRTDGQARPEPFSLLTDHDLYLFNEGSHFRMHDRLGAHPRRVGGKEGTVFGVWAPNAEHVSVVGDFNRWKPGADELFPRYRSGI